MFRSESLSRIDTARRLGENGGGFSPSAPPNGLVASATSKPMPPRPAAKTLLLLALALPVVQCVLMCVRGLLTSMGDNEGATIIGHVGTACLALWVLTLVALVIVLAIIAVTEDPSDK